MEEVGKKSLVIPAREDRLFFFFWLLDLQDLRSPESGIQTVPPTVEAWNLNQWWCKAQGMSWTWANQISSLSTSQGISVEGEQRKQPLGGGLTFILPSGNLFELDGTLSKSDRGWNQIFASWLLQQRSVSPEKSTDFKCDGKASHPLIQITCALHYSQRIQAGSSAYRGLASWSRRKADVITALKFPSHWRWRLLVPYAHWPFLFNGILSLSPPRYVTLRVLLNLSEPVLSSGRWRHVLMGGRKQSRW